MTHYVLDKKYNPFQFLGGRAELIALKHDLRHLRGFGGVELVPDLYAKYTGYEIDGKDKSLQGHLDVTYFLKDPLLIRVRIPKKIYLSIETRVRNSSFDEFIKKFGIREA